MSHVKEQSQRSPWRSTGYACEDYCFSWSPVLLVRIKGAQKLADKRLPGNPVVYADFMSKLCLCSWFIIYFMILNLNVWKDSNLRPFQLHVLSFTIHTLLDKVSDTLEPGKLDPCLQGLVEVRRNSNNLFMVVWSFMYVSRNSFSSSVSFENIFLPYLDSKTRMSRL